MLTLNLTAIVDYVDETVGSTRLIGNKDLPTDLVAQVLEYAMMRERGYRSALTLTTEGYRFCPAGPEWHDEVHGIAEDACWTWDWQRIED